MTEKRELAIKIEVANEVLKRDLGNLTVEEIKLADIRNRLVVTKQQRKHGKGRTKLMQTEKGLKGSIKEKEQRVVVVKKYIEGLEKQKDEKNSK